MNKFTTILTSILAIIVLASCGSQTNINVDIDAMAFLPADDLKGDAPIQGGYNLKIPDDNGLDSGDFGVSEEVFDNLGEFNLTMTTAFTLSEGAEPLDGNMAVYIHDTAPVFDANEPAVDFQFSLTPGEARNAQLDLTVSEESNPTLFNLLKSGSFKIGVLFTTSGDATNLGTMTSELTGLDINLKTKLPSLSSF